MNIRIALVLCFTLACTQRAQLFEGSDDRDGNTDVPSDGSMPADGSMSDGGLSADGSAPEDGATENDAGSPTPRVAVSSGLDHVCAIVDGALWCWGTGESGRLGLGDDALRTRPERVDGNDDWVAVCGGDEHTCALRADRSLYCWGRNFHGELGVGDFNARDRPARVSDAAFVRIACGGGNTCGLTGDGALSCWGDNREGKLGQDDPFATAEDSSTPVRVARGTVFREVAVGQGHVCAIESNGALWCWGRNSNGQLGIETPQEQQRSPARVTGLDNMREVAAGMAHTCAVAASGQLWCWGTDASGNGALGLGSGVESAPRPQAVGTASDWSQISVQWFHSCAVRGGTDLYCWGRNDEGQLGTGESESRFIPTRAGSTTGWSDVTVGHFHTCGIRDASVLCWGNNEAGQAGVGDTVRRELPTEVSFR